MYNIAHRTGAKLILVRVEAPVEVIAQRLSMRDEGNAAAEDRSTAGWSVYRRMASSVEPIRRGHYAVDTIQRHCPGYRQDSQGGKTMGKELRDRLSVEGRENGD